MEKYIAYYRVSTKQQGASGLGLEGQKATVENFAKGRGAVVAEYTEVESGRKDNREALAAAIATAKQTGGTLLIAKLDRLARNVSFIFAVRDAGVNFTAVDMPEANTLTIGIMAVMAQHEAELISARTRSALAAKKARGCKLGNPSNFTQTGREKGVQAHMVKAANNPHTKQAKGYAVMLRNGGAALRNIADTLNKEGFKTARGGQYSAVQVARLFG